MDIKEYVNMMFGYGNGGQTIFGKAVIKWKTTPAMPVEIMKQNKEHCIAQIIKFLESECKE